MSSFSVPSSSDRVHPPPGGDPQAQGQGRLMQGLAVARDLLDAYSAREAQAAEEMTDVKDALDEYSRDLDDARDAFRDRLREVGASLMEEDQGARGGAGGDGGQGRGGGGETAAAADEKRQKQQ